MDEVNSLSKWERAKLKEVCLKTKLVDPTKKPGVPFVYVDVSSVSNQSYQVTEVKELLGRDAPSRARKLIQTDDVIFATVRPTLRRIAMIPSKLNEQICSTGYCVLKPNRERLEPGYLYFYLLSDEILQYVEAIQKGATYPAISDSMLLDYSIPLPPLPEQQAIAHTLRAVQQAREARQRELALERERKAALMQHLFTHGTRGEPLKQTEIGEIPESWGVVELGAVIKATQYGLSLRGEQQGQYPILRMNNLVGGYVDAKDLQYVDLDDADFEKFQLRKGDILFNRTNSFELVGKTSLFNLNENFVFASYLIRVVPDITKIIPEYLNYYLNWAVTQRRLKTLATRGVSQSNINASKLRGFLVPLPTLSEQQDIAEVLRRCDSKIIALDQEIVLLEELFRAMLEELMTGRVRVGVGDTTAN